MARPSIRHAFVLLIYSAFLVSGAEYLRGFFNYRGIESWPSVEAEVMGSGGGVLQSQYQGALGAQLTQVDSSFVEFRYVVAGQIYEVRTPDHVQFRPEPDGQWRAYYNPAEPEVARLAPIRFRDHGWLTIAVFTGVFVAAHLWFTLPDLVRRSPE